MKFLKPPAPFIQIDDCSTNGEPLYCWLTSGAGRGADLANSVRKYRKGKVLFNEGQAPRGVYVLCGGRVRLGLKLTHEEIGQLIGASRETVTRLLNDFRRKKIIEVSGETLSVRDREALEALALPRC